MLNIHTLVISAGALLLSSSTADAQGLAQLTCNDDLCKALSAALADILNTGDSNEPPEAEYLALLDEYFLEDPRFLPRETDCAGAVYPKKTSGTLLASVLDKEEIRVLYAPDTFPFSFLDSSGAKTGLALAMWPLIVDRLNEEYNVDLQVVYKNGAPFGSNNQYLSLATVQDPNCTNRTAVGSFTSTIIQERCADVIGGGYAVTAVRQPLNDYTCTYMPLALSAIRTEVPLSSAYNVINFNDPVTPVFSALKSIVSPSNPLVLAGITNSAEIAFVNAQFANPNGSGLLPGVTLVSRVGSENIFQYSARQTDPTSDGAHLVLGQSARLVYTRAVTDATICANCPVVIMLAELGAGFGTQKFQCCSFDYATCKKGWCSESATNCANCGDSAKWLVPPVPGTCLPLWKECTNSSLSCCGDGFGATCTTLNNYYKQCRPTP